MTDFKITNRVQDQGGREFQTEGIHLYFEVLNFTPNAEIGHE